MSIAAFSVRTENRTEFVNVTDRVRKVVAESGIEDGICLVTVPHTTAGVTINEAADPAVTKDMRKELNKIVPFEDGYQHMEGNSAAHIKSTMTGVSVMVPVEDGKLVLGVWQGIFFCEFDGPRMRTVNVKVLG